MTQKFKVTKEILQKAQEEVIKQGRLTCCCAITMAIKERFPHSIVLTYKGGGRINGEEFAFTKDSMIACNNYIAEFDNHFDIHVDKAVYLSPVNDMAELEFEIEELNE